MDQTHSEVIGSQLDKLEKLRSGCISNANLEVYALVIPTFVSFLAIPVSMMFDNSRLTWSVCIIFLVCLAAWNRFSKKGNVDQYRDIYILSSRIAFSLESMTADQVRQITRDELEKLERATQAAANLDSVHFHSRFAISALRALKIIGDETTLELISELPFPPTASEEQRGVLDALIDCRTGIKGRIHSRRRETRLLRPTVFDTDVDDLLRPAGGQNANPTETLLRPTVGSTAGCD